MEFETEQILKRNKQEFVYSLVLNQQKQDADAENAEKSRDNERKVQIWKIAASLVLAGAMAIVFRPLFDIISKWLGN
jgi:hypothetical protein